MIITSFMLYILFICQIPQTDRLTDFWKLIDIGDASRALSTGYDFPEFHSDMPIGGKKNFFIDPLHGKQTNTGESITQAWHTLAEVAKAGYFQSKIHAGDVVWCMGGNHGAVTLNDYVPTDTVRIKAFPNQIPMLASFYAKGTQYITLDGLWITSSPNGYLVTFKPSSTVKPNIISVLNCVIFSRFNVNNWQSSDWINLSTGGIYAYDTSSIFIANNIIFNVTTGIYGNISYDASIRDNWIDNFTEDGIQIGGNGINIYRNLITDLYDFTSIHNDGVQFYYGGEDQSNIKLDSNCIVACTSLERASPNIHLQGMAGYGNIIHGLTVKNNWVISDTTNGIVFTGDAITVMNNSCWGYYYPDAFRGCSIRIYQDSDATIQNNISDSISGTGYLSHNLILTKEKAKQTWIDPAHFNFHLLDNSLAVDAGDPLFAPELDFECDKRPIGKLIDIGADEKK